MKKTIHPTKREKERINKLTDILEVMFGVQNFDRCVRFTAQNDDGENCSASVNFDTKYQRLTISIYPSFYEHNLDDQRMMLLHEFVHTLVNPVQTIAEDLIEGKFHTFTHARNAVEQSTSMITNILDLQMRLMRPQYRKAYKDYLKK